MEKYNSQGSKNLFNETSKYLVGGVSSSFHKSPLEEYPICAEYGKGSKIYDVDGNEYIDYVGGFGPMLLGYSPEAVNRAVMEQIERGSQFSMPTKNLCELSKKLTEIIPSAEMVSYQSSGTEANMYAFRIVRAYTKKNKIVKFEGQYHGWADEQHVTISAQDIGQLGNPESPNRIFAVAGQRRETADDIVIMPWNNLEALEKLFHEKADEIAAVITEPYMCDEGPIMPKEGYLEGLRELTKQYGILLVFDEVITGFRLALGGAQEYFGVTPDVSVFGKALAGGYSLSMICGKREIMSCGVPASGTFNANPIAVAASLATIAQLEKPGVYEGFERIGNLLVEGLRQLGKKHGIQLFAAANRAICQLQIGSCRPMENFRDCLENVDSNAYNKIFLLTARYGVRLTYARGRIYLSTTHTEEDIKRTLEVFDQVFSELGLAEKPANPVS